MKKNMLRMFLVLVAMCMPLAANAQPKHIAGPWTFTTEPCVFFGECDEVATINKDLLAKLTGGVLTEAKLLKKPPTPGDKTPITFFEDEEFYLRWEADFVDTFRDSTIFADNLDDLVPISVRNWVFYGILTFVADRAATATFRLGYEDYAKVWLNKQQIYVSQTERWRVNTEPEDMATRIRTRVKRGKNSLIVKIQGGIFWAFYLGVDTDARLRIAYQIRDGELYPGGLTTRWALLKVQN